MKQNELIRNDFTVKINAPIVVTGALWLVSMLLAVLCIFAIREFMMWGLGLLLNDGSSMPEYQAANIIDLIHQCTMMILGAAALGVVIVVTEKFFRQMGQPRLMRFQVKVIAVECAIIVPAALLFLSQ